MKIKLRFPAEWEPQSFIQFTFPHEDTDWKNDLEAVQNCFVQCVKAICQFQKVLVVCKEIGKVAPLVQHIPQDRMLLVECDSNDSWARDHGAITVYENGQPTLINFKFNGWGLQFSADKDNLITGKLWGDGVFGQVPLYGTDLVLEGGAIETNGQGTLLARRASLLSANRNPILLEKQLEEQLANLLGVHHFLWLDHGLIIGDDTGAHIDTLVRFCSPHKIVYVQCLDKEDKHFYDLQEMENDLKRFRDQNGQPYELIPLPLPDAIYAADGHRLPATYANFLIINGAVLVPLYGVKQDKQALKILIPCFPDREMIGIDCLPLIEQHGALQCITMQFPKGVILKR